MELRQYRADETLRDGSTLAVRALQPGDRQGLEDAVRRMSDESIYRRFFSLRREFTSREVDYYTNVDFSNHVALVGVLHEDAKPLIVAGARYVLVAPGIAEVAFAVDDAHQGLGIGGLMMKHLTAAARTAGLRQFVAEVLAANAAMLKVFEKSGLAVRTRRDQDVLHVTLDLA